MAARKKTKKRQTKSKRTADNKMTPMKKTAKKKLAMKSEGPKNKLAKKKAAQKKTVVKTKAVGKKTIGGKTVNALKKQVREKRKSVDTVAFLPEEPVGPAIGRFAGIVQRPRCGFGECRRVARGRKRVRGRRSDGRGRRWER